MKNIVLAALLCCIATCTWAQAIKKDSLAAIKPGTRINVVVDFAEAAIMGMDEKAFAAYETDWKADKGTVVANLVNGINNRLDGVLTVGDFSDSPYTLKVDVKDISAKSKMVCDARLTGQDGKLYLYVKQVNGGKIPPLPGTKLARIKYWATFTGRSLGSTIRKQYLSQ
ncbi:MAG: hypothetical protein J6M53_01320 [Bacteroidaceae bacterium]|nr:hypothetical protein [Bacteroidaceae bacterium]